MYDYYLNGKTNYAPDREAAPKVVTAWPSVFVAAQANRAFMHRATRFLAEDHGIRQWLGIGTGIPTPPNLHEVAQSVAPHARVVYIDNDPIVLAHARALLTSSARGRTTYLQADATTPDRILAAPDSPAPLDLDQPVTLSLNALLHFAHLLDALPSGSALALTHCTPEFDPKTWQTIRTFYDSAGTAAQFRTKAEVSLWAGVALKP